jgi:hypothetical protein
MIRTRVVLPHRRSTDGIWFVGSYGTQSGIIAGIEQDWSITIGRAYPDATEAFVAEATLGGGTPAVVKAVHRTRGRPRAGLRGPAHRRA